MHRVRAKSSAIGLSLVTCAAMVLPVVQAFPQNPKLAEKIQEIKAASAANKQALSHYTWQEQQTISLKGEVKKTVVYQVSVGPTGQQQKTELSSSPAPAAPSGGRLKQRIIERKTDEFKEYGQQIGALVKQYTAPDSEALQTAFQQGNVSFQPGGSDDAVRLIIKNYIKPGDSVTLVFNSQQKAIQSLSVASYLSEPSDAVTFTVQFAKLPSGVNHVASTQVNGVSKQMTVATQNSNYQQTQM